MATPPISGLRQMQPNFTKLLMEYFAENLLGDYYRADANTYVVTNAVRAEI